MFIDKEELDKIVSNSKSFYKKVEEIDGFKAEIYNYYMAYPKLFDTPLKREIRGLTFIGDKYFLSVPKFFNVNETEETEETNLRNYNIVYIRQKEDGSLIIPVLLPNGKLVTKTRATFNNKQTFIANQIVNREPYKSFILQCFENGIIPLFELVSPANQIVVPYDKTELILIMLRDLETGDIIIDYPVPESIPQPPDYSDQFSGIDDLVLSMINTEGIEGWVVLFDNGTLVKFKTQWYLKQHKAVTGNNKDLLKSILKQEIDDLIRNLSDQHYKKRYIEYLSRTIVEIMSAYTDEIMEIYSKNWNEKKEIAIQYKGFPFFHTLMSLWKDFESNKTIERDKVFNMVRKELLRKIRTEKSTLEFYKQHGILSFEEYESKSLQTQSEMER